jgi:putative DNA primase/helicase
VGYSLSGHTREQVLFFLCGAGANGKSIFLNVLLKLLGSYGKTTGADTIMRHNTGHDDLARLHKARVVAVSEVEEGSRLAEARVKDLTGQDTIAARFLYQQMFQFEPQFKLWLRGNHKPTVQGSEEGIWRRVLLIPFERVIPIEQRDPNLGEKLFAEMPGILRWAIEGFAAWKAGGLKAPPIVTAAVRDYRVENDETRMFLDECCDLTVESSRTRSSLVANSYTDWAKRGGHERLSNKALTARLQRMGFQKVRMAEGIVWRNILLKPNVFRQLLDDEM